ncbi:hypothetical protein [Streptomyces roseoviridis]|uniref:Serine/threonine protein kinase n=1 Tax=Streptomyces roseoviridis TaxID=67361 RepID=A0ABV5QP16_9ACTN
MTPDPEPDPEPAPDPDRDPGPDRAPSPRSAVAPGRTPHAAPDADAGADAEADAETEADAEPEADADTEGQLRAAFALTAYDITPGPVPLVAVRRRGRARRRRRAVALVALTVLSVSGAATVAVLSLPGHRPAHPAAAASADPLVPPVPPLPTGAVAPPVTASGADPVTEVRVVGAGQRVDAGRGWRVWLTGRGKYWSGPDGYENFRSVTDGNVETSRPGISHQSEGDASGAFHSGLYYGTRAAGRVELRDADGRTASAVLLELPGRPGWGVWYAYTPPSKKDPGSTPDVSLYDRAGKRLAELTGLPGTP